MQLACVGLSALAALIWLAASAAQVGRMPTLLGRMLALFAAQFSRWGRETSILAPWRVAADASFLAARAELASGSVGEVLKEVEAVLVVEGPEVVLVAGSAWRPAELGQARYRCPCWRHRNLHSGPRPRCWPRPSPEPFLVLRTPAGVRRWLSRWPGPPDGLPDNHRTRHNRLPSVEVRIS